MFYGAFSLSKKVKKDGLVHYAPTTVRSPTVTDVQNRYAAMEEVVMTQTHYHMFTRQKPSYFHVHNTTTLPSRQGSASEPPG
jgi:hypothetical protein